MGHRLQQRFRKLQFVIGKKRWRQQIIDLGRQIDRVGKLFGEAEALAPARQSRASGTHQAYGHVKSQASSLHKAIVKALACACACDTSHVFKLIMAKPRNMLTDRSGSSGPPARTLKVSFPLCSRSWATSQTSLSEGDSWRCFDTTMMLPPGVNANTVPSSGFAESQSTISSASRDGRSSLSSFDSISARTETTTPLSMASDGCTPPWIENTPPYFGALVISDSNTSSSTALPIQDLCGIIRTGTRDVNTGYINDGRGSYHILTSDPAFSFTSAEIGHVISLKAILADHDSTSGHEATPATTLSRRHRMSIALILAYALMELYPTPWMPRCLKKSDIYFFQKKDGTIMAENPFVLCESALSQHQPPQQQEQHAAAADPVRDEPVDDSNALLALGIVIMELWFGQTIESRSFYKDHCDNSGKEKAFTSFTAALEWQKKTIDEAGVTLHDITNRCIRGNFGESTMDLSNGSCVRAVHDQVVKPLEGMLGYIWPAKQAV